MMYKKSLSKFLIGLGITIALSWAGNGTCIEARASIEKGNSAIDWEAKELLPIEDKEMLLQIYRDKNIIMRPFDAEVEYDSYERITGTGAMESTVNTESIATDSGNYSTTNVQVEGVDEADTMKNDGRYIYLIKNEGKSITIVDTQETLKEVAVIKPEDGDNMFEQMLLDGDTLIVIGQMRKEYMVEINKSAHRQVKSYTTISIYDLTHKQKPTLIRATNIEGQISKIRRAEDKIYVQTTDSTRPFYEADILDQQMIDQQILTFYSDSKDTERNFKPIDFDHMCYEPWSNCRSTTVLAVIPIDKEQAVDVQAILGNTHESYMNEENLYLVDSNNYYSSNISYIIKYALKENKLQYSALGSVEGRVLNQFSIDEYKGNLRIATTNRKDENAIYILDSSLQVIGGVNGLAKGERIYSARFEGDKGYLVTFEETDPLFVFDLSNPKAPKTLGQLKIPGFSQYLHPVSEDLVVGIGRATHEIIERAEDGTEEVVGTSVAGIKLSLFNVKNPTNPQEINHIILGVKGSESEALENHNAVMVNSKKQMLAIPLYLRFKDDTDFSGAYVFQVENGKLVGKSKLGRLTEADYYTKYNDDSRICYIGDKIYYIYDNAVNKYDMDTFKRVETLYLK